jgi:SAM-dependent methyltransferase
VSRATLGAVAAISAAILAYEVLLMRLFSIIWWHHFAYMIISIALLGFGASGTALALVGRRLNRRFDAALAASAALFAITAVMSCGAAIRLPFNALAIIWDPRQLLWLGCIYVLVVLPFFFGGSAIGLAFSRFPQDIGRLYAFDLVGAGIGAIGIVGVLFVLSPVATLRLVAAAGFIAAALALAGSEHRRLRPLALLSAGAAFGVALWLPPGLLALNQHVSQYKGLAMALLVPGTRIVEERSSPLGHVSVVESPTIPFRHAPGLSLNNATEPPPQLGIFTDADSLSTITRFSGNREDLRYLDYTTSALPYHLLERPKVLILGVGGGEQALLAIYHHASEIDGVEINPQVVDLVNEYSDFAGGIFERPEVDVHVGEARGFIRRSDERYDLIQIPLLYSFGAALAGTQGLHESYTYTAEALQDYLKALNPGGLLSVTLWLKLPPRDTPKLFATAVEALEESGAAHPGQWLALIRSWRTTTLLVKKGAFQPGELAAVRRFAAERSFDIDYLPGISPDEPNRYNVLERPYFYEAATALIGPERRRFVDGYKFNIEPATDDRPYFFDFFRWRFLPELLALRTQGAAAMLDMGYLILFATLVQAAVLSALFIVSPLLLSRQGLGGAAPRARILVYFLALGLAFLLIEIAFMQRFILFLGHPIYAVAVVLAGFLVFAGLGSACAPRLTRALDRRGTASKPLGVSSGSPGALELAVAAIATLAAIYLLLLPGVFDRLIALPELMKIAISLALIAPLALFMGMPFPLGIRIVAAESAELVPWAWAINGCASVIAAVLATLLAIHFGFTTVVLLAVSLYVVAALALGNRQ